VHSGQWSGVTPLGSHHQLVPSHGWVASGGPIKATTSPWHEPNLPLIEDRLVFPPPPPTAKEWAIQQNLARPICECGCAQSLTILPRHAQTGIPRFRHGHHSVPMTMAGEVTKIRQQGFLTACQAARMLGIGPTTLYRLEGRAYEPAPRSGARKIRVFTLEMVAAVKAWLRENTCLGTDPLITLDAVAQLAGCSRGLLRSRLGTDLPEGRHLADGLRGRLGFTPLEVSRMVNWVQHRRKRV